MRSVAVFVVIVAAYWKLAWFKKCNKLVTFLIINFAAVNYINYTRTIQLKTSWPTLWGSPHVGLGLRFCYSVDPAPGSNVQMFCSWNVDPMFIHIYRSSCSSVFSVRRGHQPVQCACSIVFWFLLFQIRIPCKIL